MKNSRRSKEKNKIDEIQTKSNKSLKNQAQIGVILRPKLNKAEGNLYQT